MFEYNAGNFSLQKVRSVGFDYFGFPLSASFHQCSMLIFIYMLLLHEGRLGEVWEPLNSNDISKIVEHWIEKCHLVFKGLTWKERGLLIVLIVLVN
jgi:hypothetical protein